MLIVVNARHGSIASVVVVALVGLQCGPPDAGQPAAATGRPSIIVISIDALRRDHVGHYGYERDVSPYLDRLAEESLVFDRAYAVASWTLISHMTMMTGLYPRQHGVVKVDTKISPSIPLLSERLHALGYYTIGLTHGAWLSSRYDFDRGFDAFRKHRNGAEMNANLREEMAKRPPDRPLYLFLHIWDVHCGNLRARGSTIFVPPAGYEDLYVADAEERLEGIQAKRLYKGKISATEEQVEALIALYDGSIRYVDDLIASWVEEWRADGLLDDALLIVTSDHGEGLWQRDKNEDHGGVHEEGLRVPLLIRFPGGEHGGERRSEIVSHVDLVPTLLDYLELPREPWIAGRSLLDELPDDRVILAERPAERPAVTVTYRWPYKLVSRGDKTWICDLESDPDERSLITEWNDPERHEEISGVVRTAYEALVASWTPVPEGALPLETQRTQEEIEELRDLGYTGE